VTDAPSRDRGERAPHTPPPWRASRSKRIQAATIGALGAPLVAALGATWRWTVEGREHLDAIARSGRLPIIACWHGRILPAVVFFKHRGFAVMVSENFDGEWIARIIHRLGYTTARGSTSRGGARALVQMRREMAAGHAAAFTVDGPRGPAFVVQPGAVWLAKATGHPILPFHVEGASAWATRSWDGGEIPRPFTHVAMVMAAPIEVPRDADERTLESARAALEAALHGLVPRARALVRRR
jgi:lysophospholipid acyltransferase (LPLAT)-like uncharacterized protein